jgi:hypothetical protein
LDGTACLAVGPVPSRPGSFNEELNSCPKFEQISPLGVPYGLIGLALFKKGIDVHPNFPGEKTLIMNGLPRWPALPRVHHLDKPTVMAEDVRRD